MPPAALVRRRTNGIILLLATDVIEPGDGQYHVDDRPSLILSSSGGPFHLKSSNLVPFVMGVISATLSNAWSAEHPRGLSPDQPHPGRAHRRRCFTICENISTT
jgi:hypothetical protein